MLTCVTGTLLSGVVYLLLQHPEYLERLKNEVRGQAAVSTLTFEKLAGLKYLNACMYHHAPLLVHFDCLLTDLTYTDATCRLARSIAFLPADSRRGTTCYIARQRGPDGMWQMDTLGNARVRSSLRYVSGSRELQGSRPLLTTTVAW